MKESETTHCMLLGKIRLLKIIFTAPRKKKDHVLNGLFLRCLG